MTITASRLRAGDYIMYYGKAYAVVDTDGCVVSLVSLDGGERRDVYMPRTKVQVF